MTQTDHTAIKILIVDDDQAIRSGLSTLLNLSGYEVEVASSTINALQILEQSTCDLVITDIIMPGESGLSLIQDIKRYDENLKIIAISGGGKSKGLGLLNIAKKFGAVQILQKPISTTELLDTVQQVLKNEINRDEGN